MNAMLVVVPVITFWLCPLIADKSMLMLQTAALEKALRQYTLHPLGAPSIPNPVNSFPAVIV